jgi:peptidyl-prolyl cis-trans isomerase C
MKQGLALLVAAIAIGGPAAQGAERQADPPLVVNGELSLTTRDFEAYLVRIPENQREEFRASFERVTKTIDGLWAQRMLAQKARATGLDQDPLVISRAAQAQDAVLADAWLAHMEKGIEFPKNLEARALEIYKARPADFTAPELVHVQHILIGLYARTPEKALERAQEARAAVVSGKEDFLGYASSLSEDSALRTNGGDLGFVNPKTLAEPVAAAVAKMKPGEISEPVRSVYGYHIIKFLGRKPSRLKSFAEVRNNLIAVEKTKIVSEARQAALEAARADPKNTVYPENVEALKVDIKTPDAATLSKADPPQR